MARPRKGRSRCERLLARVYEAGSDLQDVADEFGMTLGELAEWSDGEGVGRTLRGLYELADTQSQLILSRYRVTVAAKLVRLANQEEDAELSRKACIDLLKLNLLTGKDGRKTRVKRGGKDGVGGETGGEEDEVELKEELLAALEKMGGGGNGE